MLYGDWAFEKILPVTIFVMLITVLSFLPQDSNAASPNDSWIIKKTDETTLGPVNFASIEVTYDQP